MNRSTRTEPGTQTRERSFRPRSTNIVCSARSFSDVSSPVSSPPPGHTVPAIGFSSAREPLHLTTVSGELPRRLKARDGVVAEVPEHGLTERLRLLEADDPRTRANEAMASEPAALDRLEEKGARAPFPQAEVRAKRGQEVGCDFAS